MYLNRLLLTTITMITSKFTNMFTRFLVLESIVLITVLIFSLPIFAEELDISDIEKTLNTEQKDEPKAPPALAVKSEHLPNIKADDGELKTVKKVTNGEISTEQKDLKPINPIAKSTLLEKIEPSLEADKGKLIVLNKITTKSTEYTLKIGEIKSFGSLSVELHKCIKATDPYNSNNWMLLTILDNKAEESDPLVFHGWVLSSNPSLSTLEHPVYEVIPLDCLVTDKK